MHDPLSLVLDMKTVRGVLLSSAVCLTGLATTAQNTFFSEYAPGNPGSFVNVMQCANGDFMCTDETWNRMMRTDSMGNVLWASNTQPYTNVRADAPMEAANGDLLTVGGRYDNSLMRYSIFLVRMDAQGNVLATDAFPVDTLSFLPWRSAPLNNGMIAHIATALNAQEVVIMVFDPSGPYAYPRIRIPVNFPLQGNAPAGFTGVFTGPGNTFFAYHGSYQPTLILTKYTTTGAALWSKSYTVNGGAYTIGMGGTMLANGNLALLVEVIGLGPGGEYLLLLDPAGDVISARALDDPDNAFDWEGRVVPVPDGSFVVHLARVISDPGEGDILLHMDANADVIAQYGFGPSGYVDDVIAVDNNRLAVLGSTFNGPSLSVMDFNGPLPTCWEPDSVNVYPVVATASTATFTSSTYTSPPLPASVTTSPISLPRAPLCSTLAVDAMDGADALEVFPSPSADGRITVRGPGLPLGCNYEVIDVRGMRCAQGRLPMDAMIDLAHLASGTYVLRLFAHDGVRTSRFGR